VDTLVPRSMKSAANCDKSCELQNSVNHRTLERKLHLGVKLKCACSSVGNKSKSRPRIRQDHPVDLSILLTGGKETNKDALSNGE